MKTLRLGILLPAVVAAVGLLGSTALGHGPGVYVPEGGLTTSDTTTTTTTTTTTNTGNRGVTPGQPGPSQGGTTAPPGRATAAGPRPTAGPARGGPAGGRGGVRGGTSGGRGAPGGGAPSRGGKYGPYKGKTDRTSKYWLGSINLPWEGSFLPSVEKDGYAGRELGVDEAVANAKEGWKLADRPTMVLVYDPSQRTHVVAMGRAEDDASFVSAARFFNLVRVDVRTIRRSEEAGRYAGEAVFLVYDADGKRQARVETPRHGGELVEVMKPVIEQDYGTSASALMAKMGTLISRKAALERRMEKHQRNLFDPATGKRRPEVAAEVKKIEAEIKKLDAAQKKLLERSEG